MEESKYDSSGKPIFTGWLNPDSDEKKKVYEVKNKALFVVLIKRHLRAIVYRLRKLRNLWSGSLHDKNKKELI